MTKPFHIIVSVTTDLTSDQRVHKVCLSLHQAGYKVLLVGRELPTSIPLEKRPYACYRFRLWFHKGLAFYAAYNIRLFLFLLVKRANVFLSNDLDTLLASYLAAKWRRKQLVFDAHEYFTEVPELINRPGVKNAWEQIEARILPKLKFAYTVSRKIAEVYQEKYGVNFELIRNFPVYREEVRRGEKENIILYQGALNVHRGLEELIRAMPFTQNAQLWIAGDGDIREVLEEEVKQLGLQKRVSFLGRLAMDELRKVTLKAKVGVSLEHEAGLNYTYALPNKVFDYIHAGVPVLYSPLQEVKAVLKGYNVGQELLSHEPQKIAAQLNEMLTSAEYEHWVASCKKAAKVFSWQKEEEMLLSIFNLAAKKK
jgi:glycosyltransferase involved in cell wall biosynthesis